MVCRDISNNSFSGDVPASLKKKRSFTVNYTLYRNNNAPEEVAPIIRTPVEESRDKSIVNEDIAEDLIDQLAKNYEMTKIAVEATIAKCLEQLWRRLKKTRCKPLRTAEYADFEITRLIADGGNFGLVFEAKTNWAELANRIPIPKASYRTHLNIIAMKILYYYKTPAESSKHQKEQFDQEYNLLLTDPHWSFLRIFNYFRAPYPDPVHLPSSFDKDLFADKTTYFTMERGEGTLRNYLDISRNVTTQQGLIIVLQILLGVKRLNKHNLCHMDLKSENIIWLNQSRPAIVGDKFVIGDFGTCVQTPYILTNSNDLLGCLMSRSPEVSSMKGTETQVYGQIFRELDLLKNDIWATGCLLFEIFNGRHPFNFFDCKPIIENGPYPELNEHNGRCCARLLNLMWQREPSQRLDPQIAPTLCSLLIWGFPFGIVADLYQPLTDEGWLELLNQLRKITKADCHNWLQEQRRTLFFQLHGEELSYENINNFDDRFRLRVPSVTVETFLKLNFVAKSTGALVKSAIDVFCS